ncbi:nucleoid occlusion protein [Lacticaseibacillus mingshuiensis]|uniref:Nucleoid occlusion protein n=1 Tax=Lacticaseibacillus mingshuiensis TaxID=2799574 RepID=A0ABW4CH33_9LACO|nr:nucleoid occlusion protein [Lacticaseibacillus mingshuiensis]
MALSFFGRKKQEPERPSVTEIPLADIVPNRFQPRKVFSKEAIAELAETIKAHGLLQPIVVREYEPGKYEIIAGERRFRAMQSLKFDTAPALVQKMSDEESAAMALIENLQREGLSAIEEAEAYTELMTLNHMTQQALAQQLGKSQSFVANKLRLLKLSEGAQQAIMNGELSERHGRELLRLDDYHQELLLHEILANDLTVQDTHQAVEKILNPAATTPTPNTTPDAQATAQPSGLSDAGAGAPTDAAASSAEPAKSTRGRKPKNPNRHQIGGRDARMAVNTLKQSVEMIRDSGFKATVKQTETDDELLFTIAIKKDKK